MTPELLSITDIETMESDAFTVDRVKGKLDTIDCLQALLGVEMDIYSTPTDYLSTIQWSSPSSSAASDSDPVSEVWRRRLCEWCYEVVDHFGFDREVVSIALNYLDRSVSSVVKSSGTSITRREFQLFAVTSLYMAIKIHGETESIEGPRQKLRIDAFVQLSRGVFKVDIIEARERWILSDLRWHVNPPTNLKFIATYLRLCPKWQTSMNQSSHETVLGGIYDVARYLTELSVCVSYFSFNFKTSATAYAAILCAIDALQSKMPLPYLVRVAFMKNIAEAANLLPGDDDVQKASLMLKELCPNMFEGDDFPSEFLTDRASYNVVPDDSHDGGTASPISVNTSHHHREVASETRRKRSRSTSENLQALEPPRS